MEKISVAIVGAGIAGLTTALCMEAIGLSCEIYEQAEIIAPVGAGIWMAPNAMQIFSNLGIADKVKKLGIELEAVILADIHLNPIQTIRGKDLIKRFQHSITAIHRAELLDILRNSLRETPIHLGYKLQDIFDQQGKKVLIFENGQKIYSSAIIAADGLHSRVRTGFFPEAIRRSSHQICWRAVVNTTLPEYLRRKTIEVWGGDSRFGFSEIKPGLVYFFAVRSYKKASAKPSAEYINDYFSKFPEVIKQMIVLADGRLIENELIDLPRLPSWTVDNCLLIGDAAHAPTPNMGQGGAQAVEDAYALLQLYEKDQSMADWFKKVENYRKWKADKVISNSYFLGKWSHQSFAPFIVKLFDKFLPRTAVIRNFDWLLKVDKKIS